MNDTIEMPKQGEKLIMWKDSYQIGVELIDQQHRALFDMVEGLVRTVEEEGNWDDKKENCKKAIEFMKQYVVMHFAAEEEYQDSIHYIGLEEHKKLHRKFTNDVLAYEKLLIKTDFDLRIVKQFAGMLTAWLIYHVADADQKIVTVGTADDSSREKTLMQCFIKSTGEILEKMANVNPNELNGKSMDKEQAFGDISITVGVVGEINGNIVYEFSKKFAFEMMRIMTFMEITEIDEMVCSAMAEISNIISGNATVSLAQKGYACDITIPEIGIDKKEEKSDLKTKVLIQSPVGELAFGTTFSE